MLGNVEKYNENSRIGYIKGFDDLIYFFRQRDVKEMHEKITSNEGSLKKKVQKRKFEILKSNITIGIKNKEKINYLKDSICADMEQSNESNFERAIFGNGWFIGFSGGKLTCYMNPNIEEKDKEVFREFLKNVKQEETEKEASIKKVEDSKEKHSAEEFYAVTMSQTETLTNYVIRETREGIIEEKEHNIPKSDYVGVR